MSTLKIILGEKMCREGDKENQNRDCFISFAMTGKRLTMTGKIIPFRKMRGIFIISVGGQALVRIYYRGWKPLLQTLDPPIKSWNVR